MSEANEKAESAPVKRLVRLLRWPENTKTGHVPWFVVLRRITVAPLLYACLCLCWCAVALGWGYRRAAQWWSDAT